MKLLDFYLRPEETQSFREDYWLRLICRHVIYRKPWTFEIMPELNHFIQKERRKSFILQFMQLLKFPK